jgi:transcriptional regulator of heat shock response
LDERQRSILGAVVRRYIVGAHPVSSRDLAQVLDMDVSPATIRNELLHLDEMGLLAQPHTSAGRVPTDKGYRFFVDYMLRDADLAAREAELLEELFELSGPEEFVKQLSRTVSRISGTLTAAGLAGGGVFYEAGFSELLDEPEFDDISHARTFGHLADLMDEGIRGLMDTLGDNGGDEDVRMFIGSENPWRPARAYTMTIARWGHPRGFKGFVAMTGPTRTDYKKHKAVARHIKKTL